MSTQNIGFYGEIRRKKSVVLTEKTKTKKKPPLSSDPGSGCTIEHAGVLSFKNTIAGYTGFLHVGYNLEGLGGGGGGEVEIKSM